MVYQKQIGLGLVGLGVCAMPLIVSLVPKVGAYAEAQRTRAEMELLAQKLQSQEELERERIAQRAKTAEELYKAGIAPNATRLRVRRYLDNPQRDPKPDTTGYSADAVVYVYDSASVCIGRIEGNYWLWKHKYPNACESRPDQ
ncbi:hypothetical protein NUACC21_74660 [Scytonema sp. NUACC21]